ncbi:MAG: DegQ family serine endoprotease [Geminicoccaceae bacterium]|nr:DegQ family serine endoprotease [Geminicoccaceae bacterium]
MSMIQRMSPRARGALAGVSALAILSTGGFALAESASGPVTGQANAAVRNDHGYADLVEAVAPAVVNVKVEGKAEPAMMSDRGPQGGPHGRSPFNDPNMRDFFERFFGQPMPMPEQTPEGRVQRGEGSGFIIDATGDIVTNAHVAGDADKITVVLQDGTELPAKRIGVDEKTDLALIKVDAGKPLPFVEFADSSKVRVGEEVIAVGNPFGLGGTVTAGIVSATGREVGNGPYDDFLQIDAPINRGNSGGPTFNTEGKVVGVNTLIFSPSGGSVGIGFAIPSNLVKEIVADLRENGTVERGWLGVQIQQMDPDLAKALKLKDDEGALVSQVFDDSPAAKAGVKEGDVIVAFGDTQITKLRDLTTAVARTDPGKAQDLTVWRDGKEKSLKVEVALMPSDGQQANAMGDDEQAKPRLGLSLAPLDDAMRQKMDLGDDTQGVVIAGVQPGSPADDKGLREGDVILEVSGKRVSDPQTVAKAVEQAAKNGEDLVLMSVRRNDGNLYVAVPLGAS